MKIFNTQVNINTQINKYIQTQMNKQINKQTNSKSPQLSNIVDSHEILTSYHFNKCNLKFRNKVCIKSYQIKKPISTFFYQVKLMNIFASNEFCLM